MTFEKTLTPIIENITNINSISEATFTIEGRITKRLSTSMRKLLYALKSLITRKIRNAFIIPSIFISKPL
jgi:hypothetical protein